MDEYRWNFKTQGRRCQLSRLADQWSGNIRDWNQNDYGDHHENENDNNNDQGTLEPG